MSSKSKKCLSDDQQAVFDQLMRVATARSGDAVATLSGYAGVGKTTVVAKLVAALVADDYRVLVTAPTNKAVAVIAGKIAEELDGGRDPESRTIHSALGLRMTERDDGTQTLHKAGEVVLGDYDVAFVDEASMLSDELFAAVMSARRRCKVVFVGDPAQLPPVQPVRAAGGPENAVSMVFGGAVPVHARLTQVMRQAEGNPIIAMATRLRECIEDERMPTIGEVAGIVGALGNQQLSVVAGAHTGMFVDWAAWAVRNGEDTRILAFTNRAVDSYNSGVHWELHPDVAGFAPGEPAVTHSPYEMPPGGMGNLLRNSESLVIKTCEAKAHPEWADVPAWWITFTRDGYDDDGKVWGAWVPQDVSGHAATVRGLFNQAGVLKFSAEPDAQKKASAMVRKAWALKNAFAHITYGYAMTAHKSQGSTFHTVLIDWQDVCIAARRDPVQAARLLYVAVTRASNNVCILVRG